MYVYNFWEVELETATAKKYRENYLDGSAFAIVIKQQINHLKNQLRNAYKESAKETWDAIGQNINLENFPSILFKSIKRFQGNDKPKTKYLKDESNEIIQEPKKKEKLFREHWQNIFRNDQKHEIFDSGNV